MVLTKIFNKIEEYLLSRFLLLKLETHEIISKFLVMLVSSILFLSLATLILVFSGITFSIMLGNYFGSLASGFAAVSLFFVLVFLVLIIFKSKLIDKPVMNKSIKEFNKLKKEEKTDA